MFFPDHYLITPAPRQEAPFLASLEASLQAGTRLLQLKAKGMSEEDYVTLAGKVITLARRYDAKVLLTTNAAQVEALAADGLHLDSRALRQCHERPLSDDYLLAISGHDLSALQQGEKVGADFAVLSPINYTSAHPDITPLGWDGLHEIVSATHLAVYALGGVDASDADKAIEAGAAGIAGHRGYWSD